MLTSVARSSRAAMAIGNSLLESLSRVRFSLGPLLLRCEILSLAQVRFAFSLVVTDLKTQLRPFGMALSNRQKKITSRQKPINGQEPIKSQNRFFKEPEHKKYDCNSSSYILHEHIKPVRVRFACAQNQLRFRVYRRIC